MKREHFPIDGLEDDAIALFAGGASEQLVLALSQAISLKRIADNLGALRSSSEPVAPR